MTENNYREAAAECLSLQNKAIRRAQVEAAMELFDAGRRRAYKTARNAGDGWGECAALYCTLASVSEGENE